MYKIKYDLWKHLNLSNCERLIVIWNVLGMCEEKQQPKEFHIFFKNFLTQWLAYCFLSVKLSFCQSVSHGTWAVIIRRSFWFLCIKHFITDLSPLGHNCPESSRKFKDLNVFIFILLCGKFLQILKWHETTSEDKLNKVKRRGRGTISFYFKCKFHQ